VTAFGAYCTPPCRNDGGDNYPESCAWEFMGLPRDSNSRGVEGFFSRMDKTLLEDAFGSLSRPCTDYQAPRDVSLERVCEKKKSRLTGCHV
jgi:hypothetical protein